MPDVCLVMIEAAAQTLVNITLPIRELPLVGVLLVVGFVILCEAGVRNARSRHLIETDSIQMQVKCRANHIVATELQLGPIRISTRLKVVFACCVELAELLCCRPCLALSCRVVCLLTFCLSMDERTFVHALSAADVARSRLQIGITFVIMAKRRRMHELTEDASSADDGASSEGLVSDEESDDIALKVYFPFASLCAVEYV